MNPDEWPHVDLKPTKRAAKGQRYVGPGGEKIDNRRELTRWERHNKSSDTPRSQCPQALACSVGSD